jgi:transposase
MPLSLPSPVSLRLISSYFGPKRVHGKRGRGAGGKTIVFGLLKRGDCVYTEIVPNASKTTLQAIIRGKVVPNSLIHTGGWQGYNGRGDLGLEKHFRVNHGNRGKSKASGMSTASSLSGAIPSIGWLRVPWCAKRQVQAVPQGDGVPLQPPTP